MPNATIRPMEDRDVEGVHTAMVRAFAEHDARRGVAPEPEPPLEQSAPRIRHLLASDPGGAWVAEHDDQIAGAALALLRDGLWGLSLLAVAPEAQSDGIGSALLARAHAYGAGARGHVILASSDRRALRAYARLGLDLHPAATASGRPRGVTAAAGVRALETADLDWVRAVGLAVRGAGHERDLPVLAAGDGATAVVLPDRGYAAWRSGSLKLLVARDEDAARVLLRAYLAAVGNGRASVDWLTSHQQWAVRACVEAGLALDLGVSAVFTGGDVGPFHPYLPSGAYL
jgi:GNAT superfamily N-acetyltransferase